MCLTGKEAAKTVVLRVPKEDLRYGRDYVFLDLYSALYLYGLDRDRVLLSIDAMAHEYYGGTKENISSVIQKFKKRKGCETISRSLFYVNKDGIKSENSFFMIDTESFYKIMNSNNRWDRKLNILFHYCCIIASINYSEDTMIDGRRGIYGYMSNAFFAKAEDVKPNAIMQYNNVLEELGLIVRIKKRWSEKYNKLLPSIYALKENEKLLNKYGESIGSNIEKSNEEDLDDLFG